MFVRWFRRWSEVSVHSGTSLGLESENRHTPQNAKNGTNELAISDFFAIEYINFFYAK